MKQSAGLEKKNLEVKAFVDILVQESKDLKMENDSLKDQMKNFQHHK